MPAMSQWARRRGDLLAEWHLLGDPRQTNAGRVIAACGTNLGDDWSKLERDDDETIVGNRCAACQGISLRWV